MSGISRIGKFVAENMGLSSFSYAQKMRNLSLNIVLGSNNTDKVAMMAITALNLAVRCFKGTIRIYFHSVEKVLSKEQTDNLKKKLTDEAIKAGALDRIMYEAGKPREGVTLALGCEIPGGYIADCAGWMSYVNRQAPYELRNLPVVSPAAVFATACAFAKLFKTSTLNNSLHTKESWKFSLLRFDTERTDDDFRNLGGLNLGSISLIGAGAIGSGVAFVLSLSDYYGDLLLIDKDRYEEPNFETTMLIPKSAELEVTPKAVCIAEILNKISKIRARGCMEEINASSTILSAKKDFLICGVDNDETRRVLDNTGARLVLNGGVGGRREDAGHILISRHPERGKHPLSSLYPKEDLLTDNDGAVPMEFSDECSRLPYLNSSMAAPFLGTALGALLVAGCAQDVLGLGSSTTYLKFDMLNIQRACLSKG